MTRRQRTLTIALTVALLALSIAVQAARVPGKYTMSGNWKWMHEDIVDTGKHTGSFFVNSKKALGGTIRYDDGCNATYELTLKRPIDDNNLGVRGANGSIVEACDGAERDYTVAVGKFAFKKNAKGRIVYTGVTKSICIAGDDLLARLINTYKGAHR